MVLWGPLCLMDLGVIQWQPQNKLHVVGEECKFPGFYPCHFSTLEQGFVAQYTMNKNPKDWTMSQEAILSIYTPIYGLWKCLFP